MPSSNFQDYNQNNPITSLWLNGINAFVFGTAGNNAQTSPLAWVRFNGTTASILQSYGIAGIVRNSAGNYTITFSQTLAQSGNVYNVTTNLAGFATIVSETDNSVTIQVANTSDVATDSSIVCMTVFGAYAPSF
jgi:hypothetical protein